MDDEFDRQTDLFLAEIKNPTVVVKEGPNRPPRLQTYRDDAAAVAQYKREEFERFDALAHITERRHELSEQREPEPYSRENTALRGGAIVVIGAITALTYQLKNVRARFDPPSEPDDLPVVSERGFDASKQVAIYNQDAWRWGTDFDQRPSKSEDIAVPDDNKAMQNASVPTVSSYVSSSGGGGGGGGGGGSSGGDADYTWLVMAGVALAVLKIRR
jgi:hypothetical protein